jgi:hypothetical protein
MIHRLKDVVYPFSLKENVHATKIQAKSLIDWHNNIIYYTFKIAKNRNDIRKKTITKFLCIV